MAAFEKCNAFFLLKLEISLMNQELNEYEMLESGQRREYVKNF